MSLPHDRHLLARLEGRRLNELSGRWRPTQRKASDPAVAFRGNDRWVQPMNRSRSTVTARRIAAARQRGLPDHRRHGWHRPGPRGLPCRSGPREADPIARSALPGRDSWTPAATTRPGRGQPEDPKAAGARGLRRRRAGHGRRCGRSKTGGSALDSARERFGRIDGVIHAAGVAGGGIIQLKSTGWRRRPGAEGPRSDRAPHVAQETPLDFVGLLVPRSVRAGEVRSTTARRTPSSTPRPARRPGVRKKRSGDQLVDLARCRHGAEHRCPEGHRRAAGRGATPGPALQ